MTKIIRILIGILLFVSFVGTVTAQPKPTKVPSMPEYPPANLNQITPESPPSTPFAPTPIPPTPFAPTPIPQVITSGGVAPGSLLLAETFDTDDAWENYTDDRGVRMRVDNGIYRVYIPHTLVQSYVWAVKQEVYSDVIIDVETMPARVGANGAYGIICRSDVDFQGNGYYFIVNANGSALIGKSSTDEVIALSDTVTNPAIKPGLMGNRIRAICVGDYLALYINDTLITEARDTEFTSGYTGITALSDGTSDTEVLYDNLDIYAGVVTGGSTLQATPTPSGIQTGQFTLGTVLLQETFDNPNAWENYTDLTNNINLRVENSVYRATATGNYYIWGLNNQIHSDVVIDVETTQLSDFLQNGYGVMCRADTSNNGDGYYFYIGGDGYYSIRLSKNDEVTQLVEWTLSDAIRQGQASNTIRAVCVGDYLALYANGTFLAEAHDTTYVSGYAGLSIAVSEGGTADITFDNLTIYKAFPQ